MIRPLLLMVGLAALVAGARNAIAQDNSGDGGGGGRRGGANFDPAQFQQQMMDRFKERLEITNDVEWAAVQGLVQKVMDARRATFSGMGFGGRRNGGGGDNAGRNGGRGAFNAPPSPEAEDLQKSLDAKASPDELKAKLAKLRDARKAKEETLAKAQDDLRKVLTLRQEATAVSMGLLQ
jgi:Spy/CpxP family protein refolding chaperone